MSKRDKYLLQARNKVIRKTFYSYLARGAPTMKAYIKTAEDFYLSERSVRKIIASKHS